MLILAEILNIISEFHVRVELVPHVSRRRDPLSQLYDVLRTKNRGEDEVKKLEEKTGKQNFALTKTRLRKKLLNSLYFIEPTKGKNSEQTIAFIQIQKQLYRCYLLQRFGGDRNLHTEARRGLKLALQFQLTKEALEFAVILRSYFCRNGALNKFRYYSTVADKQLEKYNAELQAILYYQEFIIHYYKRLSYKKETISALKHNITAITNLRDTFQSLTIGIIYFRLSVYNYDIEAKYKKVYDLSQEAILYLHKTGNVATKSDFAEFYLYQLASCIYIRDLEKGSAAYTECIGLYPEATINWFTCQELYLLLLFHTHQFSKAASVLSAVLRHRAFRTLPEFITEKWLVFDLYLQYGNGTLGAPKRRTSSKKVLRSMLQRTHQLKSDKSGFAFSVRLIYILSLLETGAFDELTEQIDAFRIYCNRYLPLRDYPKTRAFLKLIFLVEKHSYNYLVIKVKAQKYLDLLNASEIAHREANENIQILPYDLIWERIMNAIHRNSSRLAKERILIGN